MIKNVPKMSPCCLQVISEVNRKKCAFYLFKNIFEPSKSYAKQAKTWPKQINGFDLLANPEYSMRLYFGRWQSILRFNGYSLLELPLPPDPLRSDRGSWEWGHLACDRDLSPNLPEKRALRAEPEFSFWLDSRYCGMCDDKTSVQEKTTKVSSWRDNDDRTRSVLVSFWPRF